MTAPPKLEPLPIELLREVNRALADLMGCLTPEGRLHQLSHALCRAAARLGENEAVAFCRRIIERNLGEEALEELAAALLPGETYFFRDRPVMEAIQRELLARLIEERRGQRRLNFWSAACSTGEEALTLAMILKPSLAGLTDWDIRILATDLRARALEAARLGILSDGEPEYSVKPAVARLFRSAAQVYGAHAAGILLIGMGSDGAAELRLMRERGALTYAQDKESSVVHSMPGDAIRLGAAMHVLPPEKIGQHLTTVMNRQANTTR